MPSGSRKSGRWTAGRTSRHGWRTNSACTAPGRPRPPRGAGSGGSVTTRSASAPRCSAAGRSWSGRYCGCPRPRNSTTGGWRCTPGSTPPGIRCPSSPRTSPRAGPPRRCAGSRRPPSPGSSPRTGTAPLTRPSSPATSTPAPIRRRSGCCGPEAGCATSGSTPSRARRPVPGTPPTRTWRTWTRTAGRARGSTTSTWARPAPAASAGSGRCGGPVRAPSAASGPPTTPRSSPT